MEISPCLTDLAMALETLSAVASSKKSIKSKRLRAGLADEYFMNVLFS